MGALATGGGGMAAGNAFALLAGPVGWTIAGVSIVASGLMFLRQTAIRKDLRIHTRLLVTVTSITHKLAIVELSKRITRIIDESEKLREAIVEDRNLRN